MRWNRTTTLFAMIGAAATGYLAVVAYRRLSERAPGAPALAEAEREVAQDVAATRSAGRDAMRDPPKEWSKADETSDESFPASDPPPVGSRVD
jgi:hypothetical protein